MLIKINKKTTLKTDLPVEKLTTDFLKVLYLRILKLSTVKLTKTFGLTIKGMANEIGVFSVISIATVVRLIRFKRIILDLVIFDFKRVEAEGLY